jgi:Autochaperone Domain Type 1
MTGSSTMSSLNVANSSVIFGAPSAGGFKTLTVGSYVGTGANLTLNTMLGGSNSPTDQLIVNGGSATGSTSLTIKNAGGAGGFTTGAGIPVIVAVNGGTTAANAFQLANTPVVGGFEYTLDRDAANQDWYLTSTPASTFADIQNSVTALADAQFAQMVTGRLLSSLLLGANEQINSCSCGGGFASIGSFAVGAHGRWSLSDRLTLLAGASYDQYSDQGFDVTNAPIVAASLRYDLTDWGRSRPFFELGGALSPYMSVNYPRSYANGFSTSTGNGTAIDRAASVFGRVGWVARFTPIDEGAVFTDLVRGWQQAGGYSEPVTATNPFAATVSSGVDSQYVARFGAQYTHLFADRIEANVNAAVAYGFDNRFGPQVYVIDFGSVAPYPLLNSAWTEFGGRLAYRVSRNLVADAFVLGTAGGEPGRTLHFGIGVRYAF